MSAHEVATGHVRALLRLPDDLDEHTAAVARECHALLPGGWSTTPTTTPATADAGNPAVERAEVVVEVGRAGVERTGESVRLRLPQAASRLGYTTYTALERHRQRRGMVTVHAGALLDPHGRAVLLLGDKGAGKTTTAAALAGRGWTHAGDDLVVLATPDGDSTGPVLVWPGTPTAAVRDPGRPLAPKPRRALAPFATGPARLHRIVRLAVHPDQHAAELLPARPLSLMEKLRLHENLGRYIGGLPTPLDLTGTAPYGTVWPLDSPDLARWRTHMITALATHRFDHLHADSPERAAELLHRQADTR